MVRGARPALSGANGCGVRGALPAPPKPEHSPAARAAIPEAVSGTRTPTLVANHVILRPWTEMGSFRLRLPRPLACHQKICWSQSWHASMYAICPAATRMLTRTCCDQPRCCSPISYANQQPGTPGPDRAAGVPSRLCWCEPGSAAATAPERRPPLQALVHGGGALAARVRYRTATAFGRHLALAARSFFGRVGPSPGCPARSAESTGANPCSNYRLQPELVRDLSTHHPAIAASLGTGVAVEPITSEVLMTFLKRLGERSSGVATLYLLGGSALCPFGKSPLHVGR